MKMVEKCVEKHIEIDGFQFAMKVWGDSDGDPVIALHGWLDNANTFDKIAPLISDGLYLVAIDMAGHGKSHHRVNGNYYSWEYAIDVLKILDVLQWKQCSIIAHSMGTGIASIIAGSGLIDVHKLICIDGLGIPFVQEDQNVVNGFRNAFRQHKMAKKTNFLHFQNSDSTRYRNMDQAIEDRRSNSIGTIGYEASEILLSRSLEKVSAGYNISYDPLVMLSKPYMFTEGQARQFIASIQCETLILLGEQGLFSDGLFHERISCFDNASLVWLPGSHHLHLEDSHKAISILINQFLK